MTLLAGDIPNRPNEVEKFIDHFLTTVCDNSRRHILECLSDPPKALPQPAERSVGEIAQHIGLATSTTSEHLKELLLLGLLVARREGKKVYYRLRNRELVQTFHDMITALEDHYQRGILPLSVLEQDQENS